MTVAARGTRAMSSLPVPLWTVLCLVGAVCFIFRA